MRDVSKAAAPVFRQRAGRGLEACERLDRRGLQQHAPRFGRAGLSAERLELGPRREPGSSDEKRHPQAVAAIGHGHGTD